MGADCVDLMHSQLTDMSQWRSLVKLRMVSSQWASMINGEFIAANFIVLNLFDVKRKCPYWCIPNTNLCFPLLKILVISVKHPLIHSLSKMPLLDSLWVNGWIGKLESLSPSIKRLTVSNIYDGEETARFCKPPLHLTSLSLLDFFVIDEHLILFKNLKYLKLTAGLDWINNADGVARRVYLERSLGLEKIHFYRYRLVKSLTKFLSSNQ